MTRLGQSSKPFYKKYLGFIVGGIISVPLIIGAVIMIEHENNEFFFEDMGCQQWLYLNMTADERAIPKNMLDRLHELIEEHNCNWIIQN